MSRCAACCLKCRKSPSAALWLLQLKCSSNFPLFAVPLLRILCHLFILFVQAGSANSRPGPVGKSEHTKQYALSSTTLYSKCGYSLYHVAENRHCFCLEISLLSGNFDKFGWYGPNAIKYFLSSSVFISPLWPGSGDGKQEASQTLGSTSSLFCFILSSTRFAFLLISFDVRQICFVRSSTFERKRSISGQSSFLTSCNRLSHDSRSFTKYESCPAHVDQSLLGSTGGSTCTTVPWSSSLSFC